MMSCRGMGAVVKGKTKKYKEGGMVKVGKRLVDPRKEDPYAEGLSIPVEDPKPAKSTKQEKKKKK
jgi:hypothetical protein